MTLDIALPGVQTTAHSQWRIEALQMVNWGGFESHHEVRFDHGSTLMSGASGTGKSTVLDAWIALMMPSDTPFNGASNDAGGRARSAEQRNLLTYLRGKTDAARVTGSDEMRDHVLRGDDGGHVWGALAGTFVDDNVRRFTVLRTYFVPGGATKGGDVATSYATFDGYFDLTQLTPLAANRFDKRSLRSVGLRPHGTLTEFHDTVHTRLGIGGGDGGKKAMRLLARVQAGMEVKRVDTLYKSMVLEKPITYAAADSALEHFADLEASYSKMLEESNKLKALQRLPGLQDDLAQADRTTALIEAFGAERSGPTPFLLWRLRTERQLLDAAVEENRRDFASTTAAHATAKSDEKGHADRLEQIARDKRANGGDAIDALAKDIGDLQARHDDVYAASIRFQTRTEAIGLVVPETDEEFAEAQAEAAAFLAGFADREAKLNEEGQSAQDDMAPLTTHRLGLLEELASLRGRKSGVPDKLHQARLAMAQAAGLDPMTELPFVAELMDVLPDEQRWRKAIETTLGGIARTLLIDRAAFQRFSAAIDPIHIRMRLNFQAVDLAPHQEWRGDPSYVSGKLAFKDSPFSGWVIDRVTRDGTDHLCVEDAASLDGHGPRVTLAGQTRHGSRGAHGDSGDGSIIGFSNEHRIAEIADQLTQLDPLIEQAKAKVAAVQARLTSLRSQKEAHQYVADTSWGDIDHLGITGRIAELEGQITRLREANSILDQLQAEHDRIEPLLKDATTARVLAEQGLKTLTEQHGDLVSEQDAVQDQIDDIEHAQTAQVSTEHQAYLDQLYADSREVPALDTFAPDMRMLKKRLTDEANAANQARRRAVSAMEQMFEQYQQNPRWTEHNLGTSVDSADGYREILDRIKSEGLHERRDRWRKEFASWSSDDLLRLNDAFETALDEIEERLVPINRILAGLPFGGKGVLQINHRRVITEEVRVFRRDLRKLSSGLAAEVTEAQVETRFRQLREFMAQIRIPEGHTKPSTSLRDRYLDVRQHVVITAVCLDEHGNEIATYDSLGGKSGGETQELVAFIVGSALRYQLGDESRSRPRFAPVFLDEGFVKADSEFAGRAVTAWQNLGFQLIIGAPVGQVNALEPHMDLLLQVTKNSKGYSFVHRFVDAPNEGAA